MFSKFTLILLILVLSMGAYSQTGDYSVFTKDGKPSGVDEIIGSLKKADVLFLGEYHDDSVAHRLQSEIFAAVVMKYSSDRNVALSLEMFERDVQTVVNEYLSGQISESHFLSSSRPWGNYKTDYRPLLELAKEKQLPVIAANAPRRYVNMVSRSGRESLNQLSDEAKGWIAPLPFGKASPEYSKAFLAKMGGMGGEANPNGHSAILNAQSLWDATMAYSISEFLSRKKSPLVVHLNGGFHTEHRLGLPDHFSFYRPQTSFVVVTMVYEKDFRKFRDVDHAGLGDFVILTDDAAPRSKR